jgi:hypothetical protein
MRWRDRVRGVPVRLDISCYSGPSPSTDATAAYRHMLQQGNVLIRSDEGTFASSCNNGLPPLKDSCRRWALMDEGLVNQFVGLLSAGSA